MILPTPRSTWTIEAVHEYTGSGEKDTHASTLSGVDPLTWWHMPLISHGDKKDVLGHVVENPQTKFYDTTMGQPLFWQERKSMAYWKNALQRFKIKKVVNLSPGCAMLERVCVEQSIHCTSVCKNATHSSWLLNVLDRAVLAAMVTKGTAVYDGDMKASIERLFHDIIERVKAQDTDENEMPLPDQDEEL